MKQSRFTEAQILEILRAAQAGEKIAISITAPRHPGQDAKVVPSACPDEAQPGRIDAHPTLRSPKVLSTGTAAPDVELHAWAAFMSCRYRRSG